jgi:hypothetical protein
MSPRSSQDNEKNPGIAWQQKLDSVIIFWFALCGVFLASGLAVFAYYFAVKPWLRCRRHSRADTRSSIPSEPRSPSAQSPPLHSPTISFPNTTPSPEQHNDAHVIPTSTETLIRTGNCIGERNQSPLLQLPATSQNPEGVFPTSLCASPYSHTPSISTTRQIQQLCTTDHGHDRDMSPDSDPSPTPSPRRDLNLEENKIGVAMPLAPSASIESSMLSVEEKSLINEAKETARRNKFGGSRIPRSLDSTSKFLDPPIGGGPSTMDEITQGMRPQLSSL